MEQSMYHMVLRTSALTLSLVLLFVSGIVSPLTKELSNNTASYLASVVGVSARVAPTEINTLSAQLAQKNEEVTQREIAVSLKEQQGTSDMPTYILSVLVFILIVLMILNYVLDFMRARKEVSIRTSYEKVA